QKDGTSLVWDLRIPFLAAKRELSQREIEERWHRQAYGYDSRTGNQGISDRMDALVEGGDRTVTFLEGKLLLPGLIKTEEEEIRRLIAPLADPKREVREQAIREIEQHGDHAYLAVRGLAEVAATDDVLKQVEKALQENYRYRRSSHGVIDVLRQ